MTARKPAGKPRPARKAPVETLAGSAEVKEFVTFIRDMLGEFREDLAKQQDDNERFRRDIVNERLQTRAQLTMPQAPPPTQQVSGDLQQKVQQVMARQYTGLHIVRALEAFMTVLPVNPGLLRGITPDQIYDAILQGTARADQELSEGK